MIILFFCRQSVLKLAGRGAQTSKQKEEQYTGLIETEPLDSELYYNCEKVNTTVHKVYMIEILFFYKYAKYQIALRNHSREVVIR